MPILSQLNISSGDLWEMGVSIPIKNPNMERFEENFPISGDIGIGFSGIHFNRNMEARALPGSVIIIGPSADTTRDGSGNLLYYGKSEIFTIASVFNDTVNIEQYKDNYPTVTEVKYLKGDPVTIRGLANCWEELEPNIFPSLTYIQNGDYTFNREESLDDIKGFSQAIRMLENPFYVTYKGIYQKIENTARLVLNLLKGSNIRMSAWVKASLKSQAVTYGQDIDENIGIHTPTNEIDENIGANPSSNIIDENVIGSEGETEFPSIILRSTFYNDTEYSSVVDSADYIVTGSQMDSSLNQFFYKTAAIPVETISGIVGVYCKFPANMSYDDYRIFIDDIAIEHCKGTSKENDGYYKVDINPVIGLNSGTYIDPTLSKTYLGYKTHNRRGDTLSRYRINAEFESCAGYFVNDMLVLQEWNDMGYPIILRPKMPTVLPTTLFCDIDVKISPIENLKGGAALSNVKIIFEEISV